MINILIVGFNSAKFLPSAIGSIAGAAQSTCYTVRFVDNGADESECLVRERFPEVTVLPSLGNIGFGAANNYLARGAGGDGFLLLNPDTILQAKAVDSMIEAARSHPEFGIFGGTSISPNGEILPMSRLTFPTLGSILKGAVGKGGGKVPIADDTGIVEVEAVSGAFMFVTREAWERLGGFDEAFFLYAEELDLCRRFHELGGKVGIIPSAHIIHDVGSGEPASATRIVLSLRGAATYYRKHFTPIYAHLCLCAHWLSCAVRFLLGVALSLFEPKHRIAARSMRDATLKPWLWFGGYD